jgi:hypothetical protein
MQIAGHIPGFQKLQQFCDTLTERYVPKVTEQFQATLKRMDSLTSSDLHQSMEAISRHCPAALVLSAAAVQRFEIAEMVKKFHCLPESNEVILSLSGKQVLCTSYLSPEVASEFPEDISLVDMRQEIERKNMLDVLLVDVFLGDLVSVARGERVQVTPIQLMEHYCRFLFPFTLDELTADSELTDSVRDILRASSREAQD